MRDAELPEVTGVRLATFVQTPSPQVASGFSCDEIKPGPAIIEVTFTTIVVYPGCKANIDDAGDYELTLN